MEINPAIKKSDKVVRLLNRPAPPLASRTESAPADRHAARASEMSKLLQRILDQKSSGTPRHWGINE